MPTVVDVSFIQDVTNQMRIFIPDLNSVKVTMLLMIHKYQVRSNCARNARRKKNARARVDR